MVSETGRLFIKNLTYACTTEELEAFFNPFGSLAEVHITVDKETKLSKGFGVVQFLFPEHAIRAFEELSGTIFQGRIIDITPAKEKLAVPSMVMDEAELSKLSFKERR